MRIFFNLVGFLLFFNYGCGPRLPEFESEGLSVPGELIITLKADAFHDSKGPLGVSGLEVSSVLRRSMTQPLGLKYAQPLWENRSRKNKSITDGYIIAKLSLPQGQDLQSAMGKLSRHPAVVAVDKNWLNASYGNKTNPPQSKAMMQSGEPTHQLFSAEEILTEEEAGSEPVVSNEGGQEDFLWSDKQVPPGDISHGPAFPLFRPHEGGRNFEQNQAFYFDLMGVSQVFTAIYQGHGNVFRIPNPANPKQTVNWEGNMPVGREVKVAVIDNGFELGHDDLKYRWVINPAEAKRANCYREKQAEIKLPDGETSITINTQSVDDAACISEWTDVDGNGYNSDIVGFHAAWDAQDDLENSLPTPLKETYKHEKTGKDVPVEKRNHGTHVAGIIAAEVNNGIGVAGLCPTCKVLPINAAKLDGGGGLPDDYIIRGLKYLWAYNGYNKARVEILNMSIGKYSFSRAFLIAVERVANDLLLVAAASNEDSDRVSYPAGNPSVLAVAAIGGVGDLGGISPAKSVKEDSDGQFEYKQYKNKASFSNFGSHVDISAPGVSIYSTSLNNGYAFGSGTSQASPVVAGVAGLVWSLIDVMPVNGVPPEYSKLLFNSRTRNPVEYLEDLGDWLVDTADGSFLYQQTDFNHFYQEPQQSDSYQAQEEVEQTKQYLGSGVINAFYALVGYTWNHYETPKKKTDFDAWNRSSFYHGCTIVAERGSLTGVLLLLFLSTGGLVLFMRRVEPSKRKEKDC